VTQKKDIKRQKERLERLKKDAEEEKEKAREAARERILRDFEKGQLGLSANLPSVATVPDVEAKDCSVPSCSIFSYSTQSFLARPSKRKLDFDSSTVEALAREAEEAALRQIEREQAESLRHKLPDFWLPSLTPTYTSSGLPNSFKDVKIQTTCRGGNPPHPISLVINPSCRPFLRRFF